MARVVIVGASVAGVGVANELRRLGHAGEILLVDGQDHLPYDRPPLSKAVLLGEEADAGLPFHEAAHYAGIGVELVLGRAAVSLDAATRTITLADGTRLRGDAVVIASGARARRFPAGLAEGPVWTIRDLADAHALRRQLRPGMRLAVVGGGFVGAEVASSARKLGLEVAVFEAAPLPFLRILGPTVAAELAALHEGAGVALRCGITVDRISRHGAAQRLHLSDGGSEEADLVVAGLGCLPNVEWLEGSGLPLVNGVVCDAFGRTGVDGIFAAGDAAAWFSPLAGRHERHEHWTAAREQARIVAAAIAGTEATAWEAFVPYFWSDLHGRRVQVLGDTAGAEEVSFAHRDEARGAFLVEYRHGGRIVGVAGCNAGARTMRYLAQLAPAAAEAA
ncbi:NAD(P)/FAD-dependent oxidoreductase [Pararoseomonas indoligenes]|uniref:FAD-dependent oxidoreductase n=1 Tax=Roseomonas indoligenes TaxID=2820811 RepID=A0A940MYV9_9PROT|nr:FAD-dependent oxidoreductase [Pararoseomonas indoligenes]MBP0495889.1 FAD-dependent oxidoreductase [Pararoseomonas indoligenes]